jgi:hypothetical protein
MPLIPYARDQWITVVTEEALDLPVTDRDTLVALAQELPFELTMIAVSRLLAELAHVRTDAEAQVALARALFQDEALARRIESFVAEAGDGPQRVVFAEQNLTALERLLVLHAVDDAGRAAMTPGEIAKAKRAILAAPTVVEAAESRLRNAAQADEDIAFAYMIQNGAYNELPAPLNAVVRTYEMFVEIARESHENEHACPLDEWFANDYGLSVEEQFAIGYGCHAASRVLEPHPDVEGRGVVLPPLNSALYREHQVEIDDLLTATREWYAERFGELGQSDGSLAWERTPFLQRPLLRYSDGPWRVVTPRAFQSWLSDGFYHRALHSAQERDREEQSQRSFWTLRFTRFFGHLAEQYCLRIAQGIYEAENSVTVSGEQTYGRGGGLKTTDVAVASDRQLVLFEVVTARLNREMQVEGDPVLLAEALERMVFKKARQLARVARDVISGRAIIPGVDRAHLDKIWPVVVTAGGSLFQTELLWNRIDAGIPAELGEGVVQPLTMLDLEEYETLLGHIPLSYSLTDILAEKAAGAYGRVEFIRFQRDVLGTPNTTRPPVLEERWAELGSLLATTLALDPDEE